MGWVYNIDIADNIGDAVSYRIGVLILTE